MMSPKRLVSSEIPLPSFTGSDVPLPSLTGSDVYQKMDHTFKSEVNTKQRQQQGVP